MMKKTIILSTAFLAVCISVILSGCQSEDIPANFIEGKALKINFTRTESFENDDWILLDDVKFIHREDFLRKQSLGKEDSLYFIPASFIFVTGDTAGIREKMPNLNIALVVAEILRSVKDGTGKPIFSVGSGPELLINGTVSVQRFDQNPIRVSSIESYPAEIIVVE